MRLTSKRSLKPALVPPVFHCSTFLQDADMTKHRLSPMIPSLSIVGGCLLVIVGCTGILYVYAFASMVEPRHGWERWRLILYKMFMRPEVVLVLFSTVIVAVGVTIVVRSVKKLRVIIGHRGRTSVQRILELHN